MSVKKFIGKWRHLGIYDLASEYFNFYSQTEEALVFDTVTLLSTAFQKMGTADIQPYAVDCNTADSWSQGSEVFNAICSTTIEGLTGTVTFDSQGYRSDIDLDIVQVTDEGLLNVIPSRDIRLTLRKVFVFFADWPMDHKRWHQNGSANCDPTDERENTASHHGLRGALCHAEKRP
jgi:hypothetical protein